MKSLYISIAALIITFSSIIITAEAQNTNPNQNTVPHNTNSTNPAQNTNTNLNQNNNAGNTNQQNNNINNPYATIANDSVNITPSEPLIEEPSSSKHDALQEQRHILHQSGQNQVIIPPGAAGPDTSIRRIPQTGAIHTVPSESSGNTETQKRINPTIMGSPADSTK
jgi:hypothetical protein